MIKWVRGSLGLKCASMLVKSQGYLLYGIRDSSSDSTHEIGPIKALCSDPFHVKAVVMLAQGYSRKSPQ